MAKTGPAEKVVQDIRRKTRRASAMTLLEVETWNRLDY